jgi:hypothetical protein
MIVRIVGQQSFSLGNTGQTIVGADECQWVESSAETFLVRQPGTSQLNSVVGPQWMPIRQQARSINNSWGYLYEVVPVREIIVQCGQYLDVLLRYQGPFASSAGQRTTSLNNGQV